MSSVTVDDRPAGDVPEVDRTISSARGKARVVGRAGQAERAATKSASHSEVEAEQEREGRTRRDRGPRNRALCTP